MYMYSEDNNYVIKRLVYIFIIILSHHPLAHTSHPFNYLSMCSCSIYKELTVVDNSVSVYTCSIELKVTVHPPLSGIKYSSLPVMQKADV